MFQVPGRHDLNRTLGPVKDGDAPGQTLGHVLTADVLRLTLSHVN